LLLLDRAVEPDFFRSIFEHVVVATNGSFLPNEELAEVLSAPHAADLLIGGQVDAEAGVLLLFRGNLVPLVVPLSVFQQAPNGPRPDPRRFAVIDHGQTIQLGDYEAATSAILYEVDPDYRRRVKQRRREEERTFGASLRRLRIQRGLRQGDFSGISEKEIGRIERGEVEKPRDETLRKLAERLGVQPDVIEEY
jgi:DNA-binding Xre family transcriptional regulator